jgi:hypothetical protein
MDATDRRGESAGALRHEQEVDVVGHQAPSPHPVPARAQPWRSRAT